MIPLERAETLKLLLIGYAVDGDEFSRGVLADFIEEEFGWHENAADLLTWLPKDLVTFQDNETREKWKSDDWSAEGWGQGGTDLRWQASKIWYILHQNLLIPFSETWFDREAVT